MNVQYLNNQEYMGTQRICRFYVNIYLNNTHEKKNDC